MNQLCSNRKKRARRTWRKQSAFRLKFNPKLSPEAQRFISRHVEHHIRDLDMEPEQAIAAAYDEARKEGFKVPKANPKDVMFLSKAKGKKKRSAKPRANPVIGDEATSLTYRGGQGKRKSKSPFIHRFETPVRVLGLKDGSVKLESTQGERLWDWFD